MSSTSHLQGKVCLVTGATSGIGRVTARDLAQQGATVVLVGRNPAKAENTVAEIKQGTGNRDVEYLLADLSSQQAVRDLVGRFLARHPRLHLLVNNAGGVFARRQLTVDGFERTFALNHLSYFLLTDLLLDALKAAGTPQAHARIINVASRAHQRVRAFNFDDMQSAQGYFGYRAYAQSKLANLLFTYELARRLEGTNVTANAMHPGLIASGFGRDNGPLWALAYGFINALGRSPEEGADTVVYLASSPDVEGVTGQYFVKRRAVASSAASRDPAAARRLWALSAELTGARGGQMSDTGTAAVPVPRGRSQMTGGGRQ